jgi:hypothetical protein
MRGREGRVRQRGMTLMEVILSLLLLAVAMVLVKSFVEKSSGLQRTHVAVGSLQTRETLSQEAMLLGGPFRREDFSAPSGMMLEGVYPLEYPEVFAGERGGIMGGAIRQENDPFTDIRASRMGLYFEGRSPSMEIGKQRLLPPEVMHAGDILGEWFPMEGLLVKPVDNPVDTNYRYRWEDAMPDQRSPLWDFSRVLEVGDIHPVLTVQAYHADPYYIPSEVITVHYEATAPEVRYSRMDGSSSTSFSVQELEQGTNPVVLSMEGGASGLWRLHYTMDGSAPNSDSPLYTGAFTPEISEGGGALLRARAFFVNGRFPPGEEIQVHLEPAHAILTLQMEEIGEYPFPAPAEWGANQVNVDIGVSYFAYEEEVLLEANPAHGYQVEWYGVDHVDGNRAWVEMDTNRDVHVVFRMGTAVVVYDENNQIRSEDRFRYRSQGQGWSEWIKAPEVLNIPIGDKKWEFEIEDRSSLGEYRSLYPVRNYTRGDETSSVVILYSRYPLPRAVWRVAGEYWWIVPEDAPEQVYVEMIGGGAAGGAGWVSRGSHWDGMAGKNIPFQIRLQAGGGGGSGELKKGVLTVSREQPVYVCVGAGGESSNEYELAYDGNGYLVMDNSVYLREDGSEGVRSSNVPSYPAVGYGGDSFVSTMDWILEANGGRIAYNTEYANGNILGYVHGGDGGFGGGAGTILEGGNEIQGPIDANSPLHPVGGKSLSKDFVFYPFSVLEFDHGGMSGAPLWWLSNVYDARYNRNGSMGGSGLSVARDRELGLYPAYEEGGVGTWVSLAWVIKLIPSPEWRGDIYRYSPASEYTGWYSLADQQNRHLTLLDFVFAGGGGGGVRFKESYVQQHPDANTIEHEAERGWYAATWANVYAPVAPRGYYKTAGEGGSGYGAGGGGASSPWSNPATWDAGKGALGHFVMDPPAASMRNALNLLPSRGAFSQVGANVKFPSTPLPNARGMIGPPGGKGADGLVVIYY